MNFTADEVVCVNRLAAWDRLFAARHQAPEDAALQSLASKIGRAFHEPTAVPLNVEGGTLRLPVADPVAVVRTVADVIEERQHGVSGGCCDRHADMMPCDCLEVARAAEQAKPAPGICLTPECGRPAKIRGVCLRCYQRHIHAIHRDQATWQSLEAAGLVAPDRRRKAAA